LSLGRRRRHPDRVCTTDDGVSDCSRFAAFSDPVETKNTPLLFAKLDI
jgi:hypothetical protein